MEKVLTIMDEACQADSTGTQRRRRGLRCVFDGEHDLFKSYTVLSCSSLEELSFDQVAQFISVTETICKALLALVRE